MIKYKNVNVLQLWTRYATPQKTDVYSPAYDAA